MVTVISKKRACTRKAEVVDQVKAMHEKLATRCDIELARDKARDERKDRRREFKLARMQAKLVG